MQMLSTNSSPHPAKFDNAAYRGLVAWLVVWFAVLALIASL